MKGIEIALRSASWRIFLSALTVSIVAGGAWAGNKTAAAGDGARIYKDNCEACHMLGRNMIKPSREIVGSRQLESKAVFKKLLLNKNGDMPAFVAIANDRQELKALYDYVRKLK